MLLPANNTQVNGLGYNMLIYLEGKFLFLQWNKYEKYCMILSLFQIWNSNVIKDSYMGKHIFMSADECNRRVESVSLVGRGKDTVQKPGKLIVEITQSRNMMFI